MSGKSKSQQKVQKRDRILVQFEIVKSDLKWIGLKLTLKPPDAKKVGDLMDKAKKPAEFFYSLDGNKFTVDVRVGSKVTVLGSGDLSSAKDNPKGREAWVKLYENYDLATKADVEAWDKAHPDPKVIDGIKSEISRLEMDMRSDAADRRAYGKFSSYDSDGRAAGYDLTALLRDWTKEKHSSWTHYLTFLEQVDEKGDAKVIFDTYMKDGAKFPINLPAKLLDPIEHAVANGTAPDLGPARALIVKVVNTKFIPPFKKERLGLYDKLLKENAVKLKGLRKQLADAGGR